MTNPNQGDQNDRTNYPAENQPNPDGYGSGYTHGRTVERQRYESVQQVRDENNSANGFLIGILLSAVVLGGAALAYFLTQRNQAPTIQRTIVVPSASPSPSPSPSPEVRERVIERDRIVPVPQPQQSSPTVIPAPTIKVEPPKPAPAPEASPATPNNSQTESSTEQPRSTESSPSPEPTTSPNPPSPSGQ